MSIQRLTELMEGVGFSQNDPTPVKDQSIAITIVNGAASQTDTITLGGIDVSFESDATPTKKEVSDGLIAAIAASDAANFYLVSQGAGPDYDIRLRTFQVPNPTVTVSANLTVTEIEVETFGKRFIRINLDYGDYVMSQKMVIREVRLTGIADGEYMEFYEIGGDNPKIFRLDSNKPATFFQTTKPWRFGFIWTDCSIADPTSAILSVEVG